MPSPAPPEFEPSDSASLKPDPAPASPRTPSRAKGADLLLFGSSLLILLASVAWLIQSLVAADGVAAGRWGPQALLLIAAVLAAAGAAGRTYRHWSDPTRRLCQLLPQVRAGEMPIVSLSDIGGGLAPLVPLIQNLLGDLRRQRGEVKKLEQEIRQRVASRTDALEREMGSLRQKASRDALTGLYNRRMLDECLPRLIERRKAAQAAAQAATQATARAERAAQAAKAARALQAAVGNASGDAEGLCLLMIDVDNFKLLNDTLGHAAGDELLRCIGQLIRSSIRETDLAFRCGGDEFVVILDGCRDDDGRALASRLVTLVDGLTGSLRVAPPPRLSIGVSRLADLKDLTPQALLQEADRLLYEVKGARKAAGRATGGAAGGPKLPERG